MARFACTALLPRPSVFMADPRPDTRTRGRHHTRRRTPLVLLSLCSQQRRSRDCRQRDLRPGMPCRRRMVCRCAATRNNSETGNRPGFPERRRLRRTAVECTCTPAHHCISHGRIRRGRIFRSRHSHRHPLGRPGLPSGQQRDQRLGERPHSRRRRINHWL